jgi:two-component system cell cycle sensor histidine kinase/response regulator CckA
LACRPTHGLPGRVWATGKPAWTEDLLGTKDGCPCRTLAGVLQLRGAFGFPILLGQEVYGIMTIFSGRKQKRDEQLLDIMAELGKQLGHFVARKRDEEMLRRSEEQLRQAQKMEAVGQLAGGVAHDFNNLLTIINGYSEVLQESQHSDPSMRGDLEQIRKAGERAAGLTRQLLAFSRKQILQPRVLDLNDLVAEVQRMLGRLIGEDIQLFTALAPALGRVKADPGQVEQILINLAVNARDAMPTGGKLFVETSDVEIDESCAGTSPELPPGRYARLAVRDTGCGMDSETLARIFEPFFTTKEPGKGTGLGLSTVYGIGHLRATSEPGRGAAFEVYLPVVEEEASTSNGEQARLPAPGGTETILLVEDEEGVRTLTRQVLRSKGYTVLEAENGEEALRLIETNERAIDLLLTDVVMPHLGGRALAEAVTARYPEVDVLYMSGYTDDAVLRNGVQRSENDLIQKPFTMDALLYKVREVVDRVKSPIGIQPGPTRLRIADLALQPAG